MSKLQAGAPVVALALALASLSAASCGLIDSDVTDFNLKLPEKPFNVDTADWMLSVTTETMPAVACPPADCTAAADMFCSGGACTADCDAHAQCAAHVPVSVSQPFDLAHESPELQTIDSQAALKVTVETVVFKVKENTLNVATPPLDLYLAPQGVLDANSPSAVMVGNVESVSPGQIGEVPIDFTADGKKAMEMFMSAYQTPFTVIVSGNVTLSAGQEVPKGKLSGVVSVTAHAGI
jgi:hypothetical protein